MTREPEQHQRQLPLFEGEDSEENVAPSGDSVEPAERSQAVPADLVDDESTHDRVVDTLLTTAVSELKAAKGDPSLERAALCRYFKRGGGYPTEFLVDMLGVSANGILERAGYDDDAAQVIMDGLGEIEDEEIERAEVTMLVPDEPAGA